MIKYFQKLQAKKGFTLVELIVVIAIIGVLAAILIPTMLGYVTQSKVTSANSTASSIKNEIDGFLTTCDTNGYGMKKGSTNQDVIDITVTNGTWAISNVTATNFNSKGTKSWSASCSAEASSKAADDITAVLALDLKELFPEVKTGAISAMLVGGKCMGVVYTVEHNNCGTADSCFLALDTWAGSNNVWPGNYGWSNQTPGIDWDGSIVGTAPVMQLGTSDKTCTS